MYIYGSALDLYFVLRKMQSNGERLKEGEEWMPDLQLRLSQTSGDEDDAHHKSKYEMNTMLSLSPYSMRQQRENTETKTWPSQTSTTNCKPNLSLSI